ncbi:MAG: IS30 family transposase [Sodaliphilus pleomorphus]|uniref:IS30 family transposase n=1 Tax=Sodaliphilus pleomorphus TaxID=2606626 RepID=UPI002A747D10|nr:IS30 family transposase [Sodaliphilus pleomorphus]MDY2832258.1 IS30 family transposase [Sodaliphilus pleomorphus]
MYYQLTSQQRRLLLPYRHTVRLITTDNGSEFCCHKMISKALAPKGTPNPNIVFFADSFSSWQKGAIENANKLIRQYIPKSTDFSTISSALICKIQYKINRRPRKKNCISTAQRMFPSGIANFALAS